MALRLDPNPVMRLIPVIVLLLGFLVVIVNGIGQFFTLSPDAVAIIGFVAFVFVSLATFLTNMEQQGL